MFAKEFSGLINPLGNESLGSVQPTRQRGAPACGCKKGLKTMLSCRSASIPKARFRSKWHREGDWPVDRWAKDTGE